MLTEHFSKIKSLIMERQEDLITALIIITVSVGSFGLGRLSAIYDAKTPIVIKNAVDPISLGVLGTTSDTKQDSGSAAKSTLLVASKNGSKYYPQNCPAVKKISPTNLIYFASAAEAGLAGNPTNP